jgi:hypothetical protein
MQVREYFFLHTYRWREDLRKKRRGPKIDKYSPWRCTRILDSAEWAVLGSFRLTAAALYIIFTPPLASATTSPPLHPMSPSPTSVGDSPIWILFQTVLGVSTPRHPPLYCSPCSSPQSIVQVTLVCISGYVLARRGILDKSTQKVVTFISHHILFTDSSVHSQQLNIINVNFFTPCLLFSKVAFFLSPGPPQSS